MKKIMAFITGITIILIILAIKYYDYKDQYSKIKEINAKYESYYQKEIYGTDVATIVNRAVNDNETNNVKKDDKGFYIENDTDSIKVEIKIIDNDTMYQMETLYNGGMTNFVKYYNIIKFECTKIEYHSKTQRIKYMLFEQKSL